MQCMTDSLLPARACQDKGYEQSFLDPCMHDKKVSVAERVDA